MQKKIKIILYTLAVLWIAVGTQVIVNYMFRSNTHIIEAFSGTNTDFSESKIELVADYGTKYLSEDDKKDLIRYIAAAIGLNQDYELKYNRKDHSVETIASKKSKNADTTIALISTEGPEGQAEQVKQYIVMNLTIESDINSVIPYKKRMEKVMKELEVKDYETTLKFSGTCSGKKTLEEKDKIANGLLKHLQAKIVDEVRTEQLYTIYAYTGLISEYIEVQNNKINLNVAVSYDEEKDITTIYLATPIMNEDY